MDRAWSDDGRKVRTTYEKSTGEEIIESAGETAGDVFPLILLMIMIGILVALIAIIKALG